MGAGRDLGFGRLERGGSLQVGVGDFFSLAGALSGPPFRYARFAGWLFFLVSVAVFANLMLCSWVNASPQE